MKPAEVSREKAELAGLFWAAFRTPEGQRVLEYLNQMYNSRSGFDSDTHVMAFHEGRRDIVLLCNQLVAIARNHRVIEPAENLITED